MNKPPEQELDDVFHALPEWVRRTYPNMSLAERVGHGFTDAQKVWTESFLNEVRNHQATRDFLHHICQKHNLDYGQEYWNYVMGKKLGSVQKVENPS